MAFLRLPSVEPSGSLTLGQDGRYTATIPLQASRHGNDLDGREYIITVYAKDNAGNTGSAATGVTVPLQLGTDDHRLEECHRRWLRTT
jgi:hypothetical protein